MLAKDKHFSLLDPFVSDAKMKCCEYTPIFEVRSFPVMSIYNKVFFSMQQWGGGGV
jgi:hypothetical protein